MSSSEQVIVLPETHTHGMGWDMMESRGIRGRKRLAAGPGERRLSLSEVLPGLGVGTGRAPGGPSLGVVQLARGACADRLATAAHDLGGLAWHHPLR